MPKRTLQQVLSQIEALQEEAAELRAVEVKDVIERIQEAISHYGLTADDLFPPSRKPASEKAEGTRSKAKKRAVTVRQPRSSAGVPKYADPEGSGKTWTGQGKRPGWFVAAVDAGKQPSDLLIK